jgi:hypothetical protein
MDEKNGKAIKSYGPKRLLAMFANLSDKPGSTKPAEAFRDLCGELHPAYKPETYWEHVAQVRHFWNQNALTQAEREKVVGYITDTLNRQLTYSTENGLVRRAVPGSKGAKTASQPNEGIGPAFLIDPVSCEVKFVPDTLLDYLLKSLLEYRNMLAVCKRSACPHRLFVKDYPREKYCSEECSGRVRRKQKRQWARKTRRALAARKGK